MVLPKDTRELYVITYRPPDPAKVLYIRNAKVQGITIVGDSFSPHQLAGKRIRLGPNATRAEEQAQLLLDFEEPFYLNQIIKIPTRENNILNLAFVSTGEEVNSISSLKLH